MKIGIDVSQVVYDGTGVSRYVEKLTKKLVEIGQNHEFTLIGISSGRKAKLVKFFQEIRKINPKVRCILIPLPISIFEFIWNRLHIIPIEILTGKLDIFWSSDWVEPPRLKAKGITTIHDLSIYKTPEAFNNQIIQVHQRKLRFSATYSDIFLCDSEATKIDAKSILNISQNKLYVVYPGYL
jgi:glycosyltransferase involved in cell wall biosynthesis